MSGKGLDRIQAEGSIARLGEFVLIERIRGILGREEDDRIVLGIGDDTAALRLGTDKVLLVTCDTQIEDTHFRRSDISSYELGRRAMAVNLSDIASMGGTPTFALVSLGLPRELPLADFDDLFRGMRDQLAEFSGTIIGGNLAHTSEKMLVDITILGEVAPGNLLTRGGARPGDAVYVTGTLGSSAAGMCVIEQFEKNEQAGFMDLILAHRLPTPRVKEGKQIARAGVATAMIDLSDGLARDLLHLCESSKVGAEISLDRIPVREGVRQVADRLGKDPCVLVLGGGEDYELLFTAGPEVSSGKIEQVAEESGTPITQIGVILPAEQGCWWLDGSGRRFPLEPAGWDHFA